MALKAEQILVAGKEYIRSGLKFLIKTSII